MKVGRCLLAAVLILTAGQANSAGLKSFDIPADAQGPLLKAVEWSPCAKPDGEIKAGPFILPGVRDCPVEGENRPLIVISHGFGGTNLSHHDTAEALADAGFVVVAINHPDDTAANKERQHNLKALISRPVDVKRVIDFMLGSSPDAARIDPQSIGFFGFSRGGYTGLVLAGANPDFRSLPSQCQDQNAASCDHANQNSLPKQALQHDPRIKAFVIADPLSSFFSAPSSVQNVTAPIQMWGSQYGGDGVSPENLLTVASNLPDKPDFHTVPNSEHFAFLTICPAELIRNLPELCTDRQGFDRAAFHQEFNRQVIAFFKAHL
ncbi:dienelactone hydrolase [Agrobacterium vitis]|uniref:Hydrolase protein n=2 Tax=Rhizobium/Agrobacterium group TaxID=227290 RepID=B9JR09_ALLAM|nr:MULTISPECIES: dienelactone hydrolase family protein [Rhizobium/Agrobacterium group]ACM35422.1 hydrolase protein [Allorhizobium ampelinum S4]MCF1435453.1 dienelactone hydrolase [Allorhizobium ampelinum]MCF1449594.1 dienelactone hydrolase [Allorhizobium ampelinum]MCF1495492.1 dienelactone hydrolase [Allorhizobium ampelinum]MUO28210.1 dienelactone hydrolase [Agrobacterium vitis]